MPKSDDSIEIVNSQSDSPEQNDHQTESNVNTMFLNRHSSITFSSLFKNSIKSDHSTENDPNGHNNELNAHNSKRLRWIFIWVDAWLFLLTNFFFSVEAN